MVQIDPIVQPDTHIRFI